MEKITIKAARQMRGMKQEDAAKSLGISTRTLSNWETGKSYPRLDNLFAICELYGLSISDIFLG